MYKHIYRFVLLAISMGILFSSCTKDQAAQLIPAPVNGGGSGNGGGGTGGGGSGGSGGGSGGSGGGVPCDPDSVYFDEQILPILISNCAKSGCHDDASHEEGIILNSYENVMATADIEPFDLDGGKLYEAITEDDNDDRMPPPPNAPLENDEIALIAKWIMQGAQDLHCSNDSGGCDISNVTYSGTVVSILDTYCLGCHSGSAPSGGVLLSTYSGVSSVVNDGRLLGAITHSPGYTPMPYGGNKLPDCEIEQITAWIDNGAPNN